MSENRDLSLTQRKEDTREVQPIKVVRFELGEIKAHFDQNIAAINNQFDVASDLEASRKHEDQKNIYRSQIVFLESAFDFYLHELTKYGLQRMFSGDWNKTEKYKNLKIPMKQVERGLINPSVTEWFLEYINEAYSRDVMTSSEYFVDQMNMLGIEAKTMLKRLFPSLKKPSKVIGDLFQRRNRIAHQTDRAHADATQADITEQYVKDRISEIELIVNALHQAALQKG